MSDDDEVKCPKCNQPILPDNDDVCYSCDVCPECEFMKDECECGKFGKTMVPPWVARGHKFKIPTHKANWQLVWPEIDCTIDPIQAAASFYLLEAISAGVLHPLPFLQLSPFKPNTPEQDQKFFDLYEIKTKKQQNAFTKQRDKQLAARLVEDPVFRLQAVMGDAEHLLETIVERLDVTLVAYSHMAIAGELRHHSAFAKLASTDRPTSWCGWRTVHQHVGNEALADAALMFYEFGGGGYGGPPWASCAETLYGRLEGKLGPDGPEGKINKRMFIDRFWTLEHNGGCFLNKIAWSNRNMRRWDINSMRNLLNAHGSDPMDHTTLLSVADAQTTALYTTYLDCVNTIRTSRHMDALENPLEVMLKPKKVCISCHSDVTLGHYKHCSIMEKKDYYGFKPGFDDKVSSFYNTYMFDDLDGSSVEAKYLQSHIDAANGLLPYSAEGVLKIKGDQPCTVTFAAKVVQEALDGSYDAFMVEKCVNATFNQIVEGTVKIVPQELIDKKHKDKPINNYTWSLKTHATENGNLIVESAGMGYNISKGATAPEVWMATPVDVAGILSEKLGKYEIQ